MIRVAVVLFLLAGFVPLRFAAAGYEAYSCPLESVRAEVLTAIPDDWEKPQYNRSLENTRVLEDRSPQELVCDYGEAGRIFRRAHERHTGCSAEIGGFVCATYPDTVPQVSGLAQIGSGFDLDAGRAASADSEGRDVWFEDLSPAEQTLTGTNGALIGIAFQHPPDCHHCVHPNLRYHSRVPIKYLRAGTTVCIRTNENRYSIVRVLADVGAIAPSVPIQYRTCENFLPM